MRFAIALVLVSTFAGAAPLDKPGDKPKVELIVTGTDAKDTLAVIVRNNGKDDISLPYRTIPIELFEIQVTDEKGIPIEITNPAMVQSIIVQESLDVRAGKSAKVELRLARGLFPGAERPAGTLSFAVSLKVGDAKYTSKPFDVSDRK